jgi:hypothetical protein
MAILTQADYPAIRAALDSKLNDQQLPDSIVELPIYRAAADQDVLDRDPQAESRTGSGADRIRRAAIFFCAARLAPVVVRITSITIQAHDLNYAKPVFDPEKRAAELRQMAEEEIAAVVAPAETTPARPTMFTTASGRRGL